MQDNHEEAKCIQFDIKDMIQLKNGILNLEPINMNNTYFHNKSLTLQSYNDLLYKMLFNELI